MQMRPDTCNIEETPKFAHEARKATTGSVLPILSQSTLDASQHASRIAFAPMQSCIRKDSIERMLIFRMRWELKILRVRLEDVSFQIGKSFCFRELRFVPSQNSRNRISRSASQPEITCKWGIRTHHSGIAVCSDNAAMLADYLCQFVR